jgi:hypothetical protein
MRGRYLPWRSVTVHRRSTPRDNTARTKSLEISTLRAVRSMRSVLCDVLKDAALLTDQVAGRESVI